MLRAGLMQIFSITFRNPDPIYAFNFGKACNATLVTEERVCVLSNRRYYVFEPDFDKMRRVGEQLVPLVLPHTLPHRSCSGAENHVIRIGSGG